MGGALASNGDRFMVRERRGRREGGGRGERERGRREGGGRGSRERDGEGEKRGSKWFCIQNHLLCQLWMRF